MSEPDNNEEAGALGAQRFILNYGMDAAKEVAASIRRADKPGAAHPYWLGWASEVERTEREET